LFKSWHGRIRAGARLKRPFYRDWHDLLCLDEVSGAVVYIDDDRELMGKIGHEIGRIRSRTAGQFGSESSNWLRSF
jgi:hypothetical protein